MNMGLMGSKNNGVLPLIDLFKETCTTFMCYEGSLWIHHVYVLRFLPFLLLLLLFIISIFKYNFKLPEKKNFILHSSEMFLH